MQELFDRLYHKPMLLRLIGVKLSGLIGGSQQFNMFEDTPEMISLYQAIDKVKMQFGEHYVQRAVGIRTMAEKALKQNMEEKVLLLSK